MAITTNTANTTVTDRTASGNQPDNTPATGTTTGGSGGSGVSSVSSGSSNVTVTSSGGGGTGAVTISVSGGSGTGNVTGSGTTTLGHVAVFNNTSATGIQDGGPASLTIAGNSVSLGGSVSQDSITGLAATTAGIVKHTATANTLGIAVAADFPTLNQNTTGNAATVTGLSVASGKTLTANNTLTLSGTDGSTLAIGGGGTLGSAAYTASTAYVAASSGTATNLTLAGTLKDSNSSSAGSSGQVLSSLGTGTKWITPSSGGNVTGTSPTVSGNVAVFNNTTGTGIQDGGTLGTAAFTASTAYVSATTTQTAHKFLAGPTTGTAAPTFRVIDPTDVPTLNQSTTGNAATATTATTATTAGNVTGIVAVANGGTGTSGPSLINGTGISVTGSWPNQTITNTTSGLPSGAAQGQVLLEGASTAGWYNQSYNVTAFASLSAAITAAGSTGVLYFPTAYTIPSGTTISLPVIVEGLLTCSGTATFNGTIQAPLRQIFSGGTVSIGPNTPYIYPEWFGTPKTGSADDAPGIQAALLACTNSAGAYNQWVVLTASYYISSTINMVSGKMFKVVGGASFYKYGTFTGDAAVKFQYAPIGQDQGANVISDIPSLLNFTGISGLTLDGNQAIEVRGFAIKNCGYAVTIKGNTAATVGVDRACNTNVVKLNFITNCYTGFYFLDDGHAATIQGNELYCNFYTNDTLTNGIAAVRINNQDCSNWDGNLVSIKSIDLGNATSSYGFLNTSSTLLPCWILECALWMGGIGSANWSTSAFVKGPYSSCTFRMRMSGALGYFPWTTVAMTGIQNRVEFINGGGNYNYTADPAYGGQPISAYKVTPTSNSRNYFNTVGGSVTNSASFNNRYTCKYEIGAYSSIPANGLLTLYVYTPITDAFQNGTSNGYPTYAASNNFSAVPFTNEGLVFESAYDNSYVNANEVVLNFRNVSGSTISGGFFNFIFTCGL